MKTRREFLGLTAAAALTTAFRFPVEERSAPLRILILGGTGFVGPHIVHAALARGHSVAMLNRGQRAPNQNTGDFARVEAITGDRSLPTAYDNLKNRTWDIVIDTAQQVPWTRAAVQALKDKTDRFLYVSSTGVFTPYRTVDIPEDGPILLQDDPPQDPPSYGVMKAQSEIEARNGFGSKAIIVRPNYIVGPGDTTDRFTYWPVRIARGGEVLVPGRKTDFVQYTDVRDLAEWMIAILENGTTGTFNATGPYPKQTLEQFVTALAPLATTPLTYTWIEDYEWLRSYPLRTNASGRTSGLSAAVPWVMHAGNSLGHVQIDNRKAVAAGLRFRPLLTTARDTIAWRQSDAVPAALKTQPRYVLTLEQERAMLDAWKARK
ncbi:MAG: NAD-dependent epimerase/dehydratase family protein [Gemmatimonadota bacterium]